ncbi:hypothetical protein [Xanthomonas oryzae]|uniref:hypothetical protein n=1 Tax=Xanthomonas oryzae TaxID=347 RepID=UPI001034524D|nr:hypothetical protein [Xanthomonas oryzae]QBH00946.1 hypothetical protein EYC56_18765 [Xanthomonas oryzae]
MTTTDLLQRELLDEFGPYIPLSRYWRQLSLPSLDAARKAALRGTAPVECITLPGRRGWFMRTSEVARWISDALIPPEKNKRLEAPDPVRDPEEDPMT